MAFSEDIQFLYLIHNPLKVDGHILTKIGITNNVPRRLNQLKEVHGRQLELLYVFCFETREKCSQKEKELHNKYKSLNYRFTRYGKTRTEWFIMKKWKARLLIGKLNNQEFSPISLFFSWLIRV